MNKKEILTKMQEVFQNILDNEDIELTFDTTADDIEEWDSLSHVQLVVEIEKEFGVKFTSKEIMSWNKVGDMIDCISKK